MQHNAAVSAASSSSSQVVPPGLGGEGTGGPWMGTSTTAAPHLGKPASVSLGTDTGVGSNGRGRGSDLFGQPSAGGMSSLWGGSRASSVVGGLSGFGLDGLGVGVGVGLVPGGSASGMFPVYNNHNGSEHATITSINSVSGGGGIVSLSLAVHLYMLEPQNTYSVKLISPSFGSGLNVGREMRRSLGNDSMWVISVDVPRTAGIFQYNYAATTFNGHVWNESVHPRVIVLNHGGDPGRVLARTDVFDQDTRPTSGP
jgi:hypothetical protein